MAASITRTETTVDDRRIGMTTLVVLIDRGANDAI